MTGTLNGLSHTTLELQRSTGDTTGKDLALFVEELFEEFGILIVDVFDTASLETAIFFLLYIYRQGSEVADFRCLCHDLVLLYFFSYCGCCFSAVAATLFCVFSSILVETEHEETEHALVTTEGGLEFLYECGIAIELHE